MADCVVHENVLIGKADYGLRRWDHNHGDGRAGWGLKSHILIMTRC